MGGVQAIPNFQQAKAVSSANLALNHLRAELQSSEPPSAGSLLQHLSKNRTIRLAINVTITILWMVLKSVVNEFDTILTCLIEQLTMKNLTWQDPWQQCQCCPHRDCKLPLRSFFLKRVICDSVWFLKICKLSPLGHILCHNILQLALYWWHPLKTCFSHLADLGQCVCDMQFNWKATMMCVLCHVKPILAVTLRTLRLRFVSQLWQSKNCRNA